MKSSIKKDHRQKPWPLERAELIRRHEIILTELKSEVEREKAILRMRSERSREIALEELNRFYIKNQDILKYIHQKVIDTLSEKVANELSARIREAYDEIKPRDIRHQMLDTALSRAVLSVSSMPNMVTINRLTIPPINFNYATDLKDIPDFPWASN